MHTPDQARELWCPMVRIARREEFEVRRPAVGGMEVVHTEQFIPGGCNTDALGRNRVPASCRCIADKCAMWRWEESVHFEHLTRLWIFPAGVIVHRNRTGRGYCGLAGRPEVT